VDANAAPADYLLSWRKILAALGKHNEPEDRRQVRRLNDFYAGPILFPYRGGQPKVRKDKLLAWWDGLEAVWGDLERRRRDAAATIAEHHPFGRSGTVAPGIAGSVRPRRRRRSA
jgi:hypothetical protein